MDSPHVLKVIKFPGAVTVAYEEKRGVKSESKFINWNKRKNAGNNRLWMRRVKCHDQDFQVAYVKLGNILSPQSKSHFTFTALLFL